MLGASSWTVIEMVTESLPAALLAWTVIDVAPVTAEGVPLMAPVDVLNDKPFGNVPEEMLHEVAAPPVFVGVMVLMAVFLVKVNGEPA